MRSGVARRAARGVLCLLVAAELLCWALPMHAQSTVIRTRKRPSETGSPLHPFTLGAGLEFQTDSEETELNVPLVVDYNVRDFLLIHVEPNFVYIDRKQNGEANLAGVGDLETSLDAELLRERRYTPSLTAQAGVRWPTASRSAVGDPGIDCLLGLGFAKDLVFVELDSSFAYTFATSSHLQDTFEASLAIELPLTERFALAAEAVQTVGVGARNGAPKETITEGTAAWAWRATSFTTLEQGFTYKSDGSWEIILGWQYSFAGN